METSVFSFSATETGYNHIKVDKVCEDASSFFDDDTMHICVVADGHGSDNYPRTDRGAGFAVESAISCIKEFIKNADPRQVLEDDAHDYVLLSQLCKSILRDWYQSVEEDYKKYPFDDVELENVSEKYKRRYLSENDSDRHPEKAYGCTLIAFTVTPEYSFGLQIGDGKCVVIDQRGNMSEPIPWDDGCQMNVTTSICDSDAIDEFRFCVLNQLPAAVFCGSDGIDDSYASSQELYALYRSIIKIFVEHGPDVGKNEVKEYLPILTKRGSGDDVSLAIIIDQERICAIAQILETQSELFKLSVGLESKKKKLMTNGEKMDALYKRIRDFSKRDDSALIAAQDINALVESNEQLKLEIDDCESQIQEVSRLQQELICELDAASFYLQNGSQERTGMIQDFEPHNTEEKQSTPIEESDQNVAHGATDVNDFKEESTEKNVDISINNGEGIVLEKTKEVETVDKEIMEISSDLHTPETLVQN